VLALYNNYMQPSLNLYWFLNHLNEKQRSKQKVDYKPYWNIKYLTVLQKPLCAWQTLKHLSLLTMAEMTGNCFFL